jgi:hypothetical protein
MRSIIFGAAASLLGVMALSTSAEAQCWWTGYSWSCSYARHYYHPYRTHYMPYGYYYGRGQYAASRFGPEPGGGFYHVGKTNIGKTN